MKQVIHLDCKGNDQPYTNSIVTFLSALITNVVPANSATTLNLLEEAFYSTGDTRYGPKPEVEDIAHVRQIISAYVALGKPIPVLCPWGSIKARFGENIDMAEVISIGQIVALNQRVKAIYAPGIEVALRIEDTSGYELFKLEGNINSIYTGTQTYSRNLIQLIKVLDADMCIFPILESNMENADKFIEKSSSLTTLFEDYLRITDSWIEQFGGQPDLEQRFPLADEYKALGDEGWTGIISMAQRKHYYKAYDKLYHGDAELMRRRLAMYFAGSLTRHLLGMTGKQPNWYQYGFIQLAFVPPVAGLPNGYNKNYIYYRTMPETFARTHMPPWRGKGYIKVVDKGGSVHLCPKLCTWHEQKPYQSLTVTLTSGGDSVDITVDYLLESK